MWVNKMVADKTGCLIETLLARLRERIRSLVSEAN